MDATILPFRARAARDRARGEAAYNAAFARAIKAGDPTPRLTATLAQVDAEFSEAAVVNSRKLRVERAIARGLYNPANRARYSKLVESLRYLPLDNAIRILEKRYRHNARAFLIARAFSSPNPLPLDIIRELILMLRLLRRSEYRRHYHTMVRAVLDETDQLAAAE